MNAVTTTSSLSMTNGVPTEVVDTGEEGVTMNTIIPLDQFITDFGDGLLDAVQRQNPPVYQGQQDERWNSIMSGLLRKPFDAQREVVQAVGTLLLKAGNPAGVINGEMGTGKTLMGIALATVLHHEGYERCLVIAPPHLVYKWRREIIQTVPNARVWVLNGADTLRKLVSLRSAAKKPEHPEFFILGRVRMRMGFDWEPAFSTRLFAFAEGEGGGRYRTRMKKVVACSHCGHEVWDAEGNPVLAHLGHEHLSEKRHSCRKCGSPLWTLTRGKKSDKSMTEQVVEAMTQIPSIGEKTAKRLLDQFGTEMLSGMLADNVHQFINLMDEEGELIFNDRNARRMERFFGNTEVSFGQGGYQPTEYIKRYMPKNFFGTLLVDEGHEYKNQNSAQGQAMGVLASQCKKTILLTGTLMGGYADDLFHLLYRMNPAAMIEDGFAYSSRGSIGPAADEFMRQHGILKQTFKEGASKSHRTARGNTVVKSVSKAPGFGPKGIMRYVVPITAFLKLKDIGDNVLPPYEEEYIGIPMDDEQRSFYSAFSATLNTKLKESLRAGDHTLLGVVINALLAWPDCCFRDENIIHPRTRKLIAQTPSLYDEVGLMPKDRKLIELCHEERSKGRRVLVYSTYTATRDTTARLKQLLTRAGLKVAVLKSTVEASKREDWVADQVERNIDVLITNPELVKTGLDLLEFPTIVYMQTGYNVYTLQQASRRSWRIGQTKSVRVVFLGYAGTAQTDCLTLMAKKIAVAQSTSGDMPESGLDILNQDGDSIEVALAKRLVETA